MSTSVECPRPDKTGRFASKDEARDQLARMRRKYPLGYDWHAYECRCGCWHVGHKPGSLARRARAALRRVG